MKLLYTFLLILIIGFHLSLSAQNAPVTKLGSIVTTGTSAVVPVTAVNFTNISACDLVILYDTEIATPTAVTKVSTLGGTLTPANLSIPGVIIISWYATSGVTMNNNSAIFNITFNRVKFGTSNLNFFDDNSECSYATISGELNDFPLSDYYIAGTLTFNDNISPVTIAPKMTASVGATVNVPVTVTGFNNIGAVSLKLDYNPSVLTFNSADNTGGFEDLEIVNNSATGRIVVGGNMLNPLGYSLSNNSVFFTLNFTYHGGTTDLSWYDTGTSCQYAGPLSASILLDTPQSTYYINGSVGPDHATPTPTLSVGTITIPQTCGGNGTIPLTFTNVPDGTYTINYTSGNFSNVAVSGNAAIIIAPAGAYNNLQITTGGFTSALGVNASLIDPSAPGIPVLSVTPPTCSNANGSVAITSSTANLTFSFNGQNYTAYTAPYIVAANIAYSITAKNNTGCVSLAATGIMGSQPSVPDKPTVNVIQPTCSNANGSVAITSSTANLNFSFNGQNYTSYTAPFTVAANTAYSITAKNNAGCVSLAATGTMGSQPQSPLAPTAEVTQTSCSSGTGTITVSSDRTGLSFSLDGIDYTNTTGVFSSLIPNNYHVTSKNAAGCVSPQSALLTINVQPQAPDKPTVSVIPPTCSNANGSVAITSSTANLTFSFNGSAFAPYTAPFEVAAGAAYSITARNSNLCVSPAATGIMGSQPSVPDKPTVSVTPPTCSNANGSVAITSSTANLTFSFNGQNYTSYTAPFTVAANSAYSITAKNNAGCVSLAAAGIMGSQPQSPLAPTVEVTQTSCASGTGTITVSSDRTGLSFSIDGIDYTNTTGVFSPLIPGNYHVTSKNAAGCVSPQSALLTINVQPQAPDKPIVGFIIHPTCTEATGSVELNDLPSTGSWSITRTPGDITTQGTGGSTIIGGLNPGTYNFTVSYAGCTSEASANVLINSQPLSVTPSVSIASNQGTTICAGTSVTFTATPVNGGISPTYQWKVNDINAATGSTYTFVPENNDVVSCVMTSGAACATPATVNSNTVNMTVSPSVTPSVFIASNQGTTICSGTSVTFTATPVNGGTSPAYQWKVNDISTATGFTYTFVPENDDAVSCVMISGASCATPATVNSNTLNMTVNPMMPVSVSIVASANPVNPGVEVTFTASPTNGGINPVYQWKVNGENEGTNHSIFSYVPQQGDIVTCSLTSSETCVSNNLAISNEINVLFIPQGTRELVYRFANPRIINGLGSDSFEFDVQVKASEAGTFLWSGQINLSLDNTTLSTNVSEWTITKAGSFNGTNSLGNAKYIIEPSINGVSPLQMLSISYSGDLNAQNRPATSDDFVEITTTYQTIVNVRGRILSNTGMAGIDFMESQMNGQQFYKLASAPWVASFSNPNEYDPADFMDTYVERVYCAKHLWTQMEALNWADAVNTSVWDGNPTIPGGSLSNASALRIHNSASLTIPVDASLTVSGTTNIKSTNGLIIQSNNIGTGSLITATASGDGSVIAQRYMTTDAWHIVSSPLSGQRISHFLTNNADIATSEDDAVRGMMDYNPALNDWNDYFTNATTGNLETGKGFCMRTNANSVVSFNGLLQAGNQSATNLSSENWNSVGNPYTSAIGINKFSQSAANFLSENIDNFDPSYGAIYVWDKPDASNGMPGMYTIIANTPTGAPFVIQQGQAFMIKVNTGVSSVNFNSGMQLHEPALALKSTKDSWPTIKLKASINSLQVSTIIAFNNEMTKGLDPTYDAGLFKGTADLCIYSRLVEDNGIPFAIQALPANEYSSLIIPIGLNCKAGGEVVFSSEIINLPSDCKVILEDKQNKIFTDLSQKNYVTTIASNINIDDRFYLHTSNQTTGRTNDPMIGKMSAYAIRNVELIINAQVTDQAVASLYDVLGRLVLTRKLEADSRNSIKLSGIRAGIYMLYVRDSGKEYGFKIPVVE